MDMGIMRDMLNALGLTREADIIPLGIIFLFMGYTIRHIFGWASRSRSPYESSDEQGIVYRAADDGKYKYCGLRADPFASEEPPIYSLEPLDIPIPELTAEQQDKLDDLKIRVADITAARSHRTDPCTLYRFLFGKKWSVAQAEKLIREAVAWRKKWDIDNVFVDWNLDAYERCLAPWWLSGGFVGFGKLGQPVAFERIGRCKWPKLLKSLSMDVLLKIDIVHCQRCLAALEEDALRRKVPLKRSLLVIDIDGFGSDDIQFRAAYQLTNLTASRNLLLAETLGNILMINAPRAFEIAWGAFKGLLDPNTQEKVQIASPPQSLALLRRYIDDDTIPAYLGGQKTIDGDPDCSSLLAPGGLPPPERLARVRALASGETVADQERGETSGLRRRISGFIESQALGQKKNSRCCCGI